MPKSVSSSTVTSRSLSARGRKSAHPYLAKDSSGPSTPPPVLHSVKTETPESLSSSSSILSTCLLCSQAIKLTRGASDARHHYGLCYYNEGAFHSLFPPLDLVGGKVVDEVSKKYMCTSSDTCTKRKMGYKEMCMHMSTSHDVVGTIMAGDGRMGMENVVAKLFPGVQYGAKKSMVNVKEEKNMENKSESTPARRKRGPASRVKVEPSVVRTPTTTREDEDVDDPSAVSPPSMSSKAPKVEPKVEDSPPLPTPRIDRVHNCLVCGGQGKANKEGRNLNMAEGIQDSKYHYAVCYYNEGAFREFVDPGPENMTLGGEPLEEFGLRYKYKCPFVTCTRNTGRGAGKMMGYKEYSIHCGVAHHMLEKAMKLDTREGVQEIRAAFVLARKKDGIAFEEMPPVQMEEVHTCLLCHGETKEGKNLSFSGDKKLQTRYHYASCFYPSGVYLAKYPPGEQNTDQEGKPRDILGRDIKYSCEVRGCTIKRKMGYKEFCIHMSNEHMGLLEVLREDGRPELLTIADKLEEAYRKK